MGCAALFFLSFLHRAWTSLPVLALNVIITFSSEAIFGIVETQLFPAGGNDGCGWAVCIPAYRVRSLLSTWSTKIRLKFVVGVGRGIGWRQ